jgi:hypothetical protein
MRLRELRSLTAMALLGLFAFAMSGGWSIIRFSAARAVVASSASAAGALQSWTKAPGLSISALEASATPVDGARDIQSSLKRTDELAALLAVEPMSASSWLSLADMRLITGQPPGKVLAALAMSSIVGPNENDVMLDRGLFGILQWEMLPSEVRQRTITDLSGAILSGNYAARERKSVADALASKSDAARKEITELLRAEGVPDKALASADRSIPAAG